MCVMKKNELLWSVIVLIGLMLISCNTEEPQIEVEEVQQLLENVDWVMYKRASANVTFRGSEQKAIESEYVEPDITQTAAVWRFGRKTYQVGKHKRGVINYSEKNSYKLDYTDENGVFFDMMSDFERKTGLYTYHYAKIMNINTDSLYIEEKSRFTSRYDTSSYTYLKTDYYFCKFDFESFRDSIDEITKVENEKIASAQRKIIGEWYMEKMSTMTDYENGYTSENDEIHTETTTNYAETYPALKINKEHIPATNDQPSTFRIGTYKNGKATYDITPSSNKYKTEGKQMYSLSIGADDVLHGFFECYLPKQNKDGTYTLESQGLKFIEIDNNTMKIERSETKKETKVNGGVISSEVVYTTTITESWRRQP